MNSSAEGDGIIAVKYNAAPSSNGQSFHHNRRAFPDPGAAASSVASAPARPEHFIGHCPIRCASPTYRHVIAPTLKQKSTPSALPGKSLLPSSTATVAPAAATARPTNRAEERARCARPQYQRVCNPNLSAPLPSQGPTARVCC